MCWLHGLVIVTLRPRANKMQHLDFVTMVLRPRPTCMSWPGNRGATSMSYMYGRFLVQPDSGTSSIKTHGLSGHVQLAMARPRQSPPDAEPQAVTDASPETRSGGIPSTSMTAVSLKVAPRRTARQMRSRLGHAEAYSE